MYQSNNDVIYGIVPYGTLPYNPLLMYGTIPYYLANIVPYNTAPYKPVFVPYRYRTVPVPYFSIRHLIVLYAIVRFSLLRCKV